MKLRRSTVQVAMIHNLLPRSALRHSHIFLAATRFGMIRKSHVAERWRDGCICGSYGDKRRAAAVGRLSERIIGCGSVVIREVGETRRGE